MNFTQNDKIQQSLAKQPHSCCMNETITKILQEEK